MFRIFLMFLCVVILSACTKNDTVSIPPPGSFRVTGITVEGITTVNNNAWDVANRPMIRIGFTAPVNRATVAANVSFVQQAGSAIPFTLNYENNDSILVIQPSNNFLPLTRYNGSVLTGLTSNQSVALNAQNNFAVVSKIDSSDKFPQLTDSVLLDLVQQKAFAYFWDFGHPVSGMARERNSSGDLVTTGGTGFGIMAIPVAIKRNFITRSQGLSRMNTIVNFLQNNCSTYHGAFAHWLNGATGITIPFSAQDDGADIVETSYLMEGLLIARQYFNSSTDAPEISLRNKINQLWDAVEWTWFRKNNEDVLYWHWSPNGGFAINAQVRGWNEALITYVMAAASRTYAIPRIVYDNGWAGNGNIRNNNTYFGQRLPLGPGNGGPLFFEHYSFLGINPHGLNDVYANYDSQTVNHTLINYNYCKANPRRWFGYSDQCWGLTASDVPNGYNANEPNNDPGVISPTAALSSMPFTPSESMKALKFFYYKLGDRLWGNYGFYDAFKLSDPWFANSTLAIDQGPIIGMIENYRSGMLWDLFTSCPEVKTGMLNLGFTAPYL
jgi:hypothetical protein